MSQVVPLHLRNERFQNVGGVLDEEPSWLLRKIISVLSANVRIDQSDVERLQNLARDGLLVYALKYRSSYDLQFLRLRFAELGLPLPSFVFGMSARGVGSCTKFVRVWKTRLAGIIRKRGLSAAIDENVIKEILEAKGSGVLFLVDEKTTRKRYVHPDLDPLGILVDLQGRMAASIVLVPMTILYDRTPRPAIRPFWETFLGDPDRPGPLRRLLIAFRKWSVPELMVGEPINLVGEFEEFGSGKSIEEIPVYVRQKLIERVNDRIRVSRGPERLSRTEIKERVLQDPRLHKVVTEKASGEGATEQKARKQAESYIEEIAADQHIQALHFLYYFLKWLFSKVFDGIDLKPSAFSTLKRINAQGSLIIVSSHKSHFDYLLIGYLAFVNQMAVPYMAAGRNLSFWPVGTLLRKAGAFFLRRTFKGLGLYTHVFAAYVKTLVKEKVNINFYIEGGRSRTGKFMPPRVGMLAFLLQAIEEGAVEDLMFVPTLIGYDQVPEEKAYLRELRGRDKEKESFLQVIRAREILKRSFGKVYVRFHEPVSFRAFCRERAGGPSTNQNSLKENRKLLHDFAYYLMYRIVRIGVVTPIDLAAAGLICVGTHKVSRGLFLRAAEYFSEVLEKGEFEFAESLANREEGLGKALELFRNRGFVSVEASSASDDGIIYLIDEQKRANLEFYKNSLVNYLWPASLLSTLLIQCGTAPVDISAGKREEFHLLRQICSKELITDPLTTDDAVVDRTLGWFLKAGWVRQEAENQISVVNREPLECLMGIMWDMFETYYLALSAAEMAEKGGISQRDVMKRMMKIAQDLHGPDEVHPLPSLSSITVGNALTRFFEMGILEYRASRKYLGAITDAPEREKLLEFLGRAIATQSVIGHGPSV